MRSSNILQIGQAADILEAISTLKYLAILLILIITAVPLAAKNNPYGVHMLSTGSQIQDWAASLVGPGGYCKGLFMGITNSTSGPQSGWVSFVQGCYDRQMIPVCRLATNYHDGQWSAPVPDSPGNYSSFAKAVKRVVQGLPRNDTCPLYIELLNEVNTSKEWGGNANAWEYGHCLVDCTAAIRSIGDPRIKVMNAGLAGGTSFINEMFTQVPESLWAFDVYACHSYSLNLPPEYNQHNGTAAPGSICIDSYLDDLAIIAAHGRTGVQVMLTETGYALGDQTFVGFPIINEDNRADYIVRAFRDYWSKWPELIAVTPFEFLDNAGGWNSYDWIFAGSQTGPYNRPTLAHKQYYDVWNLAKPNMSRGCISGCVREAAFGSRLSDAFVILQPGDYVTTTDAMGNYYFPNNENLSLVAPGTYSLTAMKDGFANQAIANVVVSAGENTVVDFTLPASGTGSITGRAIDPLSGEGISGVKVTVSPENASTTTDSGGNYLIQNLAPSTYSVVASKTGYQTFQHASITVATNDTAILNFCLAPGSTPSYPNMLQNTDLEYGGGASGDGVANGWANVANSPRPANFAIDTTEKFSGTASQRITPLGGNYYWVGQWTGYGTIHPYKRYKYQAWCKTSNPSGEGAKVVAVLSHFGESIDAVITGSPVLTTNSGWTLLQGYGIIPNIWSGGSGRIRLELHGAKNGTTWFDCAYIGLDDRTDNPVSPPSSLTATPMQGAVRLTWNNPPNPPYSSTGTLVVYRTDRYPLSPSDGTLLADVAGSPNSSSTYVHSGLNINTRYYYAVFAHTAGPTNPSDPSFATAKPFDATAPTVPIVTDDGAYTRSQNSLHASWTCADPESGITEYAYAIGTSPGATDVVAWTSIGTATQITRPGLELANGKTYYIQVRATNGVGLSSTGVSDGIKVAAPTETIGAAKGLPNGTFVWLQNKMISAGSSALNGRIYVQEEDRSSGIAVTGNFTVLEGALIDVAGTLSGSPSEREIIEAVVEVR